MKFDKFVYPYFLIMVSQYKCSSVSAQYGISKYVIIYIPSLQHTENAVNL